MEKKEDIQNHQGFTFPSRSRKNRWFKKSKTISIKELARTVKSEEVSPEELKELERLRPKKRRDCKNIERPCPFVGCKYHLYLDVKPKSGSIKLNFPKMEVWEMKKSCVLDIAEEGPATLEEVGIILNLTRERVRQVELRGLAKLKYAKEIEKLKELIKTK